VYCTPCQRASIRQVFDQLSPTGRSPAPWSSPTPFPGNRPISPR
jgi:hypothetical protein